MILAAQPIVEVTVFGLAAGAVFGLLALGLVLIYRTTGIMNFAHWAIGLLGIVTYALVTAQGMNSQAAFVVSILVTIAMGVGAYRLFFKRVSRGNQIIVILIALGVAQLYSSAAQLINGFQQFTRLPPWLPVQDVSLGNATLRTSELITAGSAAVIAFGFLVWFRASRTGKALRAVAQNREAAMLAGIDDVKYSSIAWGIGSALAALARLLVLPHKAEAGGLINTADFTPLGTLLIPAFGAALVGGLINLPMALVGGAFFGLAQELLVLAPKPWSDLRSVMAAALIVLLLLLRTERFFATKQELEALET
jgi:branched-chain amino acid transport system permease protein